jgi:hypothetical protein
MSTQNPKINIITLDLLREYYEIYLNPYIYKYEIINTVEGEINETTIELRFDKDNFCHLLGIESTLRYSVSYMELQKYKGQLGWDNIKNGAFDFKFLKTKNKRGFTDNKSRYVFFYLIPKLAEAPKGVLYDPSKVMGKSNVDCELLFFDEFERAYVHIGIKKDEVLGYYIPKTFLIEKITENNDGLKYIADQQKITVKKVSRDLV